MPAHLGSAAHLAFSASGLAARPHLLQFGAVDTIVARVDEMPKKSTTRAIVEQSIVAGAGLVPIAGSPLAVAFAVAMGWSYNKRMRQ